MLTGALAIGGIVLGTGVASAAQAIERTSWSSVDSATPAKTITGTGDARIGAWFDDHHSKHVTKAYFTFDLTPFFGATIQQAGVFVEETAAADCTKDRATQLWVTDPAVRATWNHQPKQRAQLPGPGALGCPSGRVEWDATAAMQEAVAAGETTLTLGMTMPTGKLSNPAYGRSYDNHLQISVDYNRAPDVPTNLRIGQFFKKDCADTPLYLDRNDAGLDATVTDPDGGYLDAEFAVWPVDQPDQVYDVTSTFHESGTDATVGVPTDFLVDGKTYDWHVRALDGTATSDWSPTCRFGVDDTAPATAPTVTSTDYPTGEAAGGPGVPGTFTLDANGDTQIVGFRYGINDTYVAADQPGGTAAITITPARYGPDSVTVTGVDVAGNRGPSTRYDYFVAVPNVDCVAQNRNYIGEPWDCTMTPIEDGVTSYSYTFGDNAPVTVPPAADGTATFTVVPTHSGQFPVVVTETHADGTQATTQTLITVDPTRPVIYLESQPVGVGQPTPIELSGPFRGHLVAYHYTVDGGAEQTVDADTGQNATITITVTTAGTHVLRVTGVTGNGYLTDPAELQFDAVDIG